MAADGIVRGSLKGRLKRLEEISETINNNKGIIYQYL